jgi:hypothetical protein
MAIEGMAIEGMAIEGVAIDDLPTKPGFLAKSRL